MNIKKSNKKLYSFILLMIVCGTLVITNVLFTMVTHYHIWSGQNVLESPIASSIVVTDVPAKRGNIYDRNFNVIAQEVKAYTIVAYLDEDRVDLEDKPAYVEDAKITARKLKRILKDEINERDVRKTLENAMKHNRVQTELGPGTKRLDKEMKEKIEKANIQGIDFIEAIRRDYPSTPFASNIVGFAAFDEETQKIEGKLGFEQLLNKELSGKDGEIQYQQTSKGVMLPGTKRVHKESVDGNDVVLTIDANLQSIIEQQLQSTMKLNKAKSAWAIAVEIETGKVLGWGSYPTFDQNKPKEIPSYIDNLATMEVEPGSVMKPFVYATAIDTGVYPKGKSYTAGTFTYDVNDAGKIVRIQNGSPTEFKPIKDALGTDFGTLTFERGLAVSSNIAICELLANYINYKDFDTYLDKFGFFKPIENLHIPQVAGRKNIGNATDYMSTGFGQGSSISFLQLIQAYTALFNDGKMMRPYVVDSIENLETGEVLEDMEPKVVGQPISKETAHEVCEIMKGVTEGDGTGERFTIPGVDMLMKTGTGEIYNVEEGKYDSEYYSSSAIGAAPADDPKILVYWGMVSSNIVGYPEEPFQTIMKAALIANGISGSNVDLQEEGQEEIDEEKWDTYTMPALQNHSVEYAQEKLKNKNIKIEWIGDGNTILKQYPDAHKTVYSNDRIFLVTNHDHLIMPDMTGWTRKDITAFWQLTGIGPAVSGYGKVVSQNIKPGKEITKKSEINLTLE